MARPEQDIDLRALVKAEKVALAVSADADKRAAIAQSNEFKAKWRKLFDLEEEQVRAKKVGGMIADKLNNADAPRDIVFFTDLAVDKPVGFRGKKTKRTIKRAPTREGWILREGTEPDSKIAALFEPKFGNNMYIGAALDEIGDINLLNVMEDGALTESRTTDEPIPRPYIDGSPWNRKRLGRNLSKDAIEDTDAYLAEETILVVGPGEDSLTTAQDRATMSRAAIPHMVRLLIRHNIDLGGGAGAK